MPPFLGGLKRKIKSEDKNEKKIEQNEESGSEEELLNGELRAASEDDTDTENEAGEDTDSEVEDVMYPDNADSTLGDDEDVSAESSDLTDSEADDESGDGDDDDEDEEEVSSDEAEDTSKVAESDSDSKESGLGQTDDGSSEGNKEKEKSKTKKKSKTAKKADSSSAVAKLQQQIASTRIVEGRDEYSSGDTSDEEDRRTTTGAVPAWWYDEYPHVGYDLDGRRVMKPPQRDQIEEFLKRCEDPDWWRTVRDPATGQDVVLSAADLRLVADIRAGRVPDPDYDEYQPWTEWFTREVLAAPVRGFPDHKRSFTASKGEMRAIGRVVHALRMGWLKTRKEREAERRAKKERNFYNLWSSDAPSDPRRRMPAPRRALPGHAESYRPPPEYLLDSKEMKEWNKNATTPWKRKYTFLPTAHASLRALPAYPRYTRERFLRCLDLYLAPRAIKMKLQITADQLLPQLPSPRDLQPFPTSEAVAFRGHAKLVRDCDFDPTGQFLVSGSDDCTVKVWETSTGRCVQTFPLPAPVAHVRWAPGSALLLAGAGRALRTLRPAPPTLSRAKAELLDELLGEAPKNAGPADTGVSAAKWCDVSAEEWARGERLRIEHVRDITSVSWHAKGDYVCVTIAAEGGAAVHVHQLSRRRSQRPLARPRGPVQAALFHPTRPCLFVATQRCVRIYDLVKQELVKKLQPGAQWISSLALHPAGDNLLVGTYDRKLVWFDLDMSARPYQALRVHGKAVRAVAFHKRYPLFASGGDDKYIVVSHGMVYNDLLQNPLLVPLKQLPAPRPGASNLSTGGAGAQAAAGADAEEEEDTLSTLALRWHPTQPWLLAAGADKTLRLFS